MAAPRALWLALVGLYEETAILVASNLAWVLTSLLLFLVLALITLPFAGVVPGGGPEWVLAMLGWILLFMPHPPGIALASIATVAAGPDVPRLSLFWSTLRERWRIGLICFVISLVITVALMANVYFYANFTDGILRFVTILWLYGVLFWFAMHVYVLQLLVHVAEPRIFDIYRRAAFIALGHPIFTLILLVELLVIGTLCVIFVPAYVLVGPAYLAMVQAHAFREIRRRHGDLVEEVDEDMAL